MSIIEPARNATENANDVMQMDVLNAQKLSFSLEDIADVDLKLDTLIIMIPAFNVPKIA
jgi:uncharacterized membrane protein